MSYYLQPIMLIIWEYSFIKKVSLQKWAFILLALCGVLLTITCITCNHPILFSASYLPYLQRYYIRFSILMKRVNLDFSSDIYSACTGVVILLPFIHFQALSVTIICLVIIGLVHT